MSRRLRSQPQETHAQRCPPRQHSCCSARWPRKTASGTRRPALCLPPPTPNERASQSNHMQMKARTREQWENWIEPAACPRGRSCSQPASVQKWIVRPLIARRAPLQTWRMCGLANLWMLEIQCFTSGTAHKSTEHLNPIALRLAINQRLTAEGLLVRHIVHEHHALRACTTHPTQH